MRILIFFALVTLTSACWQAGQSQPLIEARVGIVYDGDSFLVKRGRNEIELRLYGIDAPEKGQAWSGEAKTALKKMIAGKMLRIEILEQDRYDRGIARVYRASDGLNINEAMVRDGHAWVYRQYIDRKVAADRKLLQLEKRARQKRTGLWQLPEDLRTEPWEWRDAG